MESDSEWFREEKEKNKWWRRGTKYDTICSICWGDDSTLGQLRTFIETLKQPGVLLGRHGRASPSGGLETTQGEFWMSKRAMNMHPVYLYCVLAEMTPCPRHMYHKTTTGGGHRDVPHGFSSRKTRWIRVCWGKLTVAQALVSCISFRFSCQMDYLDMLQPLGPEW